MFQFKHLGFSRKTYIICSTATLLASIVLYIGLQLQADQITFSRKHESVKIDWHDYHYIEYEKNRVGVGEQGVLADGILDENDLESELFEANGFNAALSDKISVNRSVPDIRNANCRLKKYSSQLPTVSVIIPFYNEHLSTLVRSVNSIINKSPPQLLTEIILVDDCSSKEKLTADLDEHLRDYPKVRIIRLAERKGLVYARLTGAKLALSEVLVFLDSHIECNTNWLPPLLDPIVENAKYCVCPKIDIIAWDTFNYRSQDAGARGIFDWNFDYKRIPLADHLKDSSDIHESPVMAGGLFAINAEFFWSLGGYDNQLDIWGGEQYELSFKIWQCGGKIYDVPCSRIGHVFRRYSHYENPRDTDYLAKNFKRVAEVWMDEYKEFLYDRDRNRYDIIDPGKLTEQIKIRNKLECKSFQWYLDNVAYDLLENYPAVEPPERAFGVVQSVAHPKFCIDSFNRDLYEEIGLEKCEGDLKHPVEAQFWSLSWYKDVREKMGKFCWEVSSDKQNTPVLLRNCHGQQRGQLWRYDEATKWLISGTSNLCLDCDIKTETVFVNKCDKENPNMQWEWGVFNATAKLKGEVY